MVMSFFFCRKPNATLIASFDTPLNAGRSRTRTALSPRIRSTFAPIASDISDSRSNSRANASSTRDSSAGRGSGASVRSFRCACCASDLGRGRFVTQPVSQDRKTIGKVEGDWLVTSPMIPEDSSFRARRNEPASAFRSPRIAAAKLPAPGGLWKWRESSTASAATSWSRRRPRA